MTASPAALRGRTVFTLLAGRGTFRLCVQVMSVALVAVWGADAFGRYTNALGLCAWLLFVTTAPEKAALKVLPRARLLVAPLAGLVLRIAIAPVALLGIALVAGLLVAPGSVVVWYLAAGTWTAGTGLLMTISGLHRLRGKPVLDTVAFSLATVVVLAATTATWLIRWSPEHHLLVLVGGITVVICCAALALPAQWRRPAKTDRRLLPALGRSVWLLGMSDLMEALAGASVYAMFSLTGHTADSGPFYLAVLGSGVVCQFLSYRLKLVQPRTSASQRGTSGRAAQERAMRMLAVAERFGIGFAVVIACCVAVPEVRRGLTGQLALPALIGLTCVEVCLWILVYYPAFLLENTNSKVLSVTSSASVAGLIGTTVSAIVLVPTLGAFGGMAAAMLGFAVKAVAIRRLYRRQQPEFDAGGVRTEGKTHVHTGHQPTP